MFLSAFRESHRDVNEITTACNKNCRKNTEEDSMGNDGFDSTHLIFTSGRGNIGTT